VIRAITDPTIPNNSGCFRAVSVHIPEGTLLSPRRPAPVSIRAHTLKRVVDALLGALAQAIPERIAAASHGSINAISIGGINPRTHLPWVYMEANAGGTGALTFQDGVDNLDTDLVNARNIPAEALELESPFRLWKDILREDSGGDGRYRGGLGTERILELLDGEAVVSHRSDRHFTAPWGLMGGNAGAKWRTIVERADGEELFVPARLTFTIRRGDRIHIFTGGGGGYGDPLERDTATVLADVLDHKISVEKAREVYGVVLDASGTGIDEAATLARRKTTAAARGPINWIFDRGENLPHDAVL
jgi:N-methylhydantoinase B